MKFHITRSHLLLVLVVVLMGMLVYNFYRSHEWYEITLSQQQIAQGKLVAQGLKDVNGAKTETEIQAQRALMQTELDKLTKQGEENMPMQGMGDEIATAIATDLAQTRSTTAPSIFGVSSPSQKSLAELMPGIFITPPTSTSSRESERTSVAFPTSSSFSEFPVASPTSSSFSVISQTFAPFTDSLDESPSPTRNTHVTAAPGQSTFNFAACHDGLKKCYQKDYDFTREFGVNAKNMDEMVKSERAKKKSVRYFNIPADYAYVHDENKKIDGFIHSDPNWNRVMVCDVENKKCYDRTANLFEAGYDATNIDRMLEKERKKGRNMWDYTIPRKFKYYK